MYIKAVRRLAKVDEPLFLEMVRQIATQNVSQNKITSTSGGARPQGVAEGKKCGKMKLQGPKKDFKSV